MIIVNWLDASFTGDTDSIVSLDAGIFNSAISIGRLGASSIDGTNNIVLLGILIFVGKMIRFCGAIYSYYISKQLFCAIGSRSSCRDLVDITIYYKDTYNFLHMRF